MSFRALKAMVKNTTSLSPPHSSPEPTNTRRVTIAEAPARPSFHSLQSSSSVATNVSTPTAVPVSLPIEKFFPIYKPETLTSSINLCCERIRNLVNRFQVTHAILRELKPQLDPELDALKDLFSQFSPLWNEEQRKSHWSADVQGKLVIALLTLQFRVADFERVVFDMLFNDLNAKGSVKPDPQKFEMLLKYRTDFRVWRTAVERLLERPAQPVVSHDFTSQMNSAFNKTFELMSYLVSSDVALRVDARTKDYDFEKDPDYQLIKYRLQDVEWRPPALNAAAAANSADGPVAITTLTFKEPVRRRPVLPAGSSKSSVKSTEAMSGPVFVHKLEIARKTAGYERRIQEMRKLAVLLSQQNFCSRFPRFYGCIEYPDSEEVNPKTGDFLRPDAIYILSDASDQETLAELIENLQESPISPDTLRKRMRIVTGVAEALFYLHESKIFHKDIRPVNVIIHRDSVIDEDDFQPRLTGFTKSRQADMGSRQYGADAYDIYWEPPNYRGSRYSAEDDVYKHGLLMAEVALWRSLQNDPAIEEISDETRAELEVTRRLNQLKEKFARETPDYGH